ncbi:hypothetical protein [Glycomyces sp. NPDC048151]|uniref:hypothetical protein n=1 Tax=Glycomyces sp. NPDC048151 TaxID=3364002 RepID=UPI0037150421
MSDRQEDEDDHLAVDEQALADHATALQQNGDDLEATVRMLAEGDVNAVAAFAFLIRGFDRIDPVDLRVGGSEDARDLAEHYKARVYDQLAGILDRSLHATRLGGERLAETAAAYREAQEATAADFEAIEADLDE